MTDELPGLGALPEVGEQGTLLGVASTVDEVVGEVPDPVAHVHVVVHQPHLDQVFDYLVPASLHASAVPGARVEVDIAGSRAQGFIVARDSRTTSGRRLRPLRRVYSGIPVLAPHVYEAAQVIAARFAGGVADVLALAIPNRHARAEREFERVPSRRAPGTPSGVRTSWDSYIGGPAFIRHLSQGNAPRAVTCLVPEDAVGMSWLVDAVRACRASGRGSLIVAPGARECRRIASLLENALEEGVALVSSEDSHEERYAGFLKILGGEHRIVVGTRSAVWAPVASLGLAVVIDDAAPALREQRAPYYSARDVLSVRARIEGAALIVAGTYVSLEAAQMVEARDAAMLRVDPARIHGSVPRVSSAAQWERVSAHAERIPEVAFALVRSALKEGPVLVVVPRAGYIPLVACVGCSRLAECPSCGGSMGTDFGSSVPRCGRCGLRAESWHCPECGNRALRAARIGSHRTAEEIGRAFPGVGIVISGAQAEEGIIEEVSSRSRLVVATPGAEPVAEGGYAAALVLDSRFLRGDGPGSDIAFIRKISRIVARVRPAREGGHVMFAGGIEDESVRMLGSWAQEEFARSALAERGDLLLPPAHRWLCASGRREDVRAFLARLRSALATAHHEEGSTQKASDALLAGGVLALAPGYDALGPVPGQRQGEISVYVRARERKDRQLSRLARASYREYTAKKIGAPLRIEMDPSV